MILNDPCLLSAVIQSNIFHNTHIAFCSDKIIIVLHIVDLEKKTQFSRTTTLFVLLLTVQTKALLLELATNTTNCPFTNTTAVLLC